MRTWKLTLSLALALLAGCDRSSTPEPPENLVPGARIVPPQRAPAQPVVKPDTIADPKDTARIHALMVSYFDAQRFRADGELPRPVDICGEDASEADPGHWRALAAAKILDIGPTVGDSVSVRVEYTTVADLEEIDEQHMNGVARVQTDTLKWTIRPAKHPWRGKLWEVCAPGYAVGRDVSKTFFFFHERATQDFDYDGLKWSSAGTTWETVRGLADSVAAARGINRT